MLKRTEGIVLRTFPFGEADLIVTYLTFDFGLIKLFAKSPRKIKSRFGSSLEPITRSKISFWGKEDSALPKLTQSDIVHSFQSMRDSFNCFLKILEIIELTLSFIPESDINKKVYSLLLSTLKAVENNRFSESLKRKDQAVFTEEDLLINHYKVKFLEFVGYSPKIDACGRCGKGGYFFYLSQGSVLCEACSKGKELPIKLSPAVLKLYENLTTWDTRKIHRIKPSHMLLSELSDVINMHIRYILSKPLKSEAFIHSLTK
jgi:DNA repair protein RecO (recombination protein O)